MIATQLTLDEVIQMTMQVGEDWAIAHAKRLIELVKQIGGDLPYDAHVMALAAYMHDWGAIQPFLKLGRR